MPEVNGNGTSANPYINEGPYKNLAEQTDQSLVTNLAREECFDNSLFDDVSREPYTRVNNFLNELKAELNRPLAPGLSRIHKTLEKVDPLHRSAILVDNPLTKWCLGGCAGGPKEFLAWCQQEYGDIFQLILSWLKKMCETDVEQFRKQGVKYVQMHQRLKYVVEIDKSGRLLRRKSKFPHDKSKPKLLTEPEPYDTTGCVAGIEMWSEDFGIWVQGPSGAFYANTHKIQRFHHSSFEAGNDVKAAGTWQVLNGRLEFITSLSGHYYPTLKQFRGALSDLMQMHQTVLDRCRVIVFGPGSRHKEKIFAQDYLRDPSYDDKYRPGPQME